MTHVKLVVVIGNFFHERYRLLECNPVQCDRPRRKITVTAERTSTLGFFTIVSEILGTGAKEEQGPCYKKFDPGIVKRKQPPRDHCRCKYIYTSVVVLWIAAKLMARVECIGRVIMV
jgi:hypothetical protein